MSCSSWLRRLAVASIAVGGAILAGCDQPAGDGSSSSSKPGASAERTSPLPQVAVLPVPTEEATEKAITTAKAPVASQPVNTVLKINDETVGRDVFVQFPPAKLRVKKTEQGLLATLYSDDPPAAAGRDYKGNSYTFKMQLDVSTLAELDGARWARRDEGSASDTESDNPTDGVFLEGFSTQLQPADVAVLLEGKPPLMIAKIVGRFKAIEPQNADVAPHGARVEGMLPVTVEIEK